MNNRNWLVRFSVSLYVLFFAIAFWSTLPSSVTGSMGGTSSTGRGAACKLRAANGYGRRSKRVRIPA